MSLSAIAASPPHIECFFPPSSLIGAITRIMTYHAGVARAANDGAPAVTSVSVGEARELVAAGHTYLDVRTPEEFRASHVEGSVNIPFMLKSPSGMVKNDAFIADVKAQFDEDTPLVVACQGGVRSIRAAAELQNAGFSGITDMLGGFAAWQQKGFPSVF
ncbi:unnamed protein product [Closterium sp. Naga37s-1]|nr:unnamed protein product [Closterium sp. Naga37s-1]